MQRYKLMCVRYQNLTYSMDSNYVNFIGFQNLVIKKVFFKIYPLTTNFFRTTTLPSTFMET